jgi:HD-GYP domain-containing protein (c-di-GMP phosphodiesterase class II)/GGDEF domain-containing protein
VAVVLAVVAVLLAAALIVVVLRGRAAYAQALHELARCRAEAETERERLEEQLGRARRATDEQRRLVARLQRAWRAEREWSRELRGQVMRLGAGTQRDARPRGDVRDLVLQAAMQLAESERGMLLTREDADGDGELDVVVARGFEHDPRDSAVAQRFAREVLERDVIIRDDDPTTGHDEPTPADREFESLVAVPLYLRDRFDGVVVCANRPGGFEDLDDEVLLALGDHASAALHHGRMRHELDDAQRAAIRVLIEAVASSEPVLHRESLRLVIHALHLATELELDHHEREVLVCAVLLRTVGHLALPDHVLRKPAELTAEERALVEMHPRIAFDVVGQAPALRDVAITLLHHQERYDGSGYPAGLAGDEIPLLARALAVLEAYGAITSGRSHQEPRSPEEACQELVAAGGTQFDPEIAGLLVEDVRRSPAEPSDRLAESVLEALPLDPMAGGVATLGPLGGPSTDGLTLLGDRRALQEGVAEAVRYAPDGRPFALAVVQLEDLARINREASFVIGDRAIRAAARNAKHVAARLGGTAYRASGRRLAILVPLRDGIDPPRVEDELAVEFAGGPAARHAVVAWESGEDADDLLTRARRAVTAGG